jgi:putative membrane protein
MAEGLPFGAAVWVIADEAVVPALGLSKSGKDYPLSTHVYAIASHLVFGLTTELVRRNVRRALGDANETSH